MQNTMEEYLCAAKELLAARFELAAILERDLVDLDQARPLYTLLAFSHGLVRRAGLNPLCLPGSALNCEHSEHVSVLNVTRSRET